MTDKILSKIQLGGRLNCSNFQREGSVGKQGYAGSARARGERSVATEIGRGGQSKAAPVAGRRPGPYLPSTHRLHSSRHTT